MLENIIHWSIKNRIVVLIITLILGVFGWYSVQQTALDALPDLSDKQVIIRTSYSGQSPQVVEDQITYPLSSTMLSVPGAKAVRGYSFFGDSYVYVIFNDEVDIYWARSRVLEYLSQTVTQLPKGIQPRLGPDASGVGWVYSYALVDKKGTHNLSQLRSLQDWFLKFELQAISGVAEVASIGGMVRQYQVVADPERLRFHGVSLSQLKSAIENGNRETGGSVIELSEAEYMVNTRGYLTSIEDIESIPVIVKKNSAVLLIRDLARVQVGPKMRRAIADLDGEGEVAGGIIVMRDGENALTVIKKVKKKLQELKQGLPEGIEIVETYNRSGLILRAVDNLSEKLIEEFIVVALVSLLFLMHLRSALVVVISLPLGIVIAFIALHIQGVNANIMSLGGIAIAIGAMVDAAIVMIENAHKHLERWQDKYPTQTLENEQRWKLITEAAVEVGPALFFSLLIITLSFVPVFALEAQEGRMFSPLAFTKSYAMAAAAGLSVTLVPVLMGYTIRGKLPKELDNPLSRWLINAYNPLLKWCLSSPFKVVIISIILTFSILIPIAKMGTEFMPELNEGDLMYMPTTLPGLSIGKAKELLQQTDRLIKSIPEVKQVFGKIGRADTATDPAPLTMIETLIQLKPKDEWRDGMDLDALIDELDRTVNIPGLTNAWVMPIKTRIDMLSTGIKTPIGVKVAGTDLAVIEEIGKKIEHLLTKIPGTASVYSERVTGGRYIEITPNREKAALLGFNISDIQDVTSAAVGGINVSEMVQGRERYSINIRYDREYRDDLEKLKELTLHSSSGVEVPLSEVARVEIIDGPPMLKSENGRLNGLIFININRSEDIGSYVKRAQELVSKELKLPTGYSVSWVGQYEHMQRAKIRLQKLIPATLLIIFLLIYLTFKDVTEALLIMATLPFSLVGGFWLVLLLDFHMSVAMAVGFIALAGVAAEFGIIMLVYLNSSYKANKEKGKMITREDLKVAIIEGAVMRIRPKAMTVTVIIAGLLPIMIGDGTGSEIMQRIAAPIIGGMITASLLSLFVIPSVYLLWRARSLKS
ncbi:Cobalt-zinc-cadmium resistance protein CzcA; Cation efflux system protein CusA [hydrothermal vent metagenome]|uniref:Cobalt-zinc-cadmium resistance protein CzcA Cation efflux system protein CusA n=1 Tax=hydrothermal vent metagenome TaxID=652676 RepID=A0A1W1CIX3_9ZZZZ